MHAALLAVLVFCAAGYLLWGLWATLRVVGDGLVNSLDLPAGADFIAFYAAAHLATIGEAAAAYDPVRHLAAEQSFLVPEAPKLPWSYPPTLLLVLRPLAAFAPETALWLWLLTGIALAFVLARVLTDRFALGPVAVIFPGIGHSLICGQTGTMTALTAAVVFRCWSSAPIAAGVALGCLSFKPHFAIVPTLLALIERRWRMLAAAIATGAALVALSLAVDGAAPWLALLESAPRMLRYVSDGALPIKRMVSVFPFVRSLGGAAPLAAALHGLHAALMIALAVLVWRSTTNTLPRALAFALATVLAPPYAYDYDLALLAIPAAIIATRAPETWSTVETRWIVSLSALPIMAYAFGAGMGFQPAPVILTLMLAAVAAAPLAKLFARTRAEAA